MFLRKLVMVHADTIFIKATIVEGEREGSIWNILDGEFRDPTNTVNQIVNSSFQILFDIILLSIPIPILWRLRIRNSAKGT